MLIGFIAGILVAASLVGLALFIVGYVITNSFKEN